MIRLGLNPAIRDNFALVLTDANVAINLQKPIAIVPALTPQVLICLRSKRLLDLDGVVDIEAGVLKQVEEVKEHGVQEEIKKEKEIIEVVEVEPKIEAKQESKPKGKSRSGANK